VTDKDKQDIGVEKYGQFWSGNSFVIQYSYGGNDGFLLPYVPFFLLSTVLNTNMFIFGKDVIVLKITFD
jgi:hypothetical protein